MSELKDIESQRRKLWSDIVVAYTSAGNSVSKSTGKDLADYFLKEFDVRFKGNYSE